MMRIRHITRAALAALALGALAAPAQAGDPGAGRVVFERYCQACHGADGAGVWPGMPNFTRGERLMRPDPVVLQSIRAGKGSMPPFGAMLKNREILDVIAYLRTFVRRR